MYCIDMYYIYWGINGIVVQKTDSVNLLGVKIDSVLNFNKHVQSICIKASDKVRAFSRIALSLEYEKMLCYIILLCYLIFITVH